MPISRWTAGAAAGLLATIAQTFVSRSVAPRLPVGMRPPAQWVAPLRGHISYGPAVTPAPDALRGRVRRPSRRV